MCPHEQSTTLERGEILVRHRAQTQLLESLHLDTIMNDISERKDLTTLQSPLRLADGSHHTEAETRIIVNLDSHTTQHPSSPSPRDNDPQTNPSVRGWS